MKRSVLVVLALVLANCSGDPGATGDLAEVHSAADAIEEAQSFAAEIRVDLVHPLTQEVISTISGTVDLTKAQSAFEGHSDDGDSWEEIVVDGTSYHFGGEVVNAPDWCAVPVSKIDGNALIQIGPLFRGLPDLLRSATDASAIPEASTATETAYRVSFDLDETASGARLEDDEATLWLDKEGRLVRAEFAFAQPVGGSEDHAVGHVVWVLSEWGVSVDVAAPPADEVAVFPDCI